MLTLRHYELLIVLSEELHFGRAAERLGISQPQLTQQLKQMEELIGTLLFARNRRRVELAPAGALLLPEARAVLRHAQRAEAVALQAAQGAIGDLALGYIGASAVNGILAQLLKDYRARAPETRLRLSLMDLDRQIPEVAAGNLDAGIVRLPYPGLPDDLAVRTLCEERMMLALPEGHPLACSDAPLRLADLADEPFLATHLPGNSGFAAAMSRACTEAGVTPNIVHRSPQFSAIVSLVAAGLGVAMVPEATQRVAIPGAVYRPLADVTQTANISLVYRKSSENPALHLFLSCLQGAA